MSSPVGHRKSLLLYGGGLDSTSVFLHMLGQRNWECLWFNYGQRARLLEYEAMHYFCHKYSIPWHIVYFDMRQIARSAILRGSEPHELNKLEGRNAVFVMMAATCAATFGFQDIVLGYHQEPVDAPFPDATEHAVRAMNTAVRQCYSADLRVIAPYSGVSREALIRSGYEIDPEIFDRTHTCYEAVPGGCGTCAHCKQKEVLVRNILTGSNDPLPPNA